MKIINKLINNKYRKFGSNVKKIIKLINVANIADRDEYLKISVEINQVIKYIKQKIVLYASKIPIRVEIPLPPLNFNQIGNKWPNVILIIANPTKFSLICNTIFKGM